MIETEIARPILIIVIVFGVIVLYKYLKALKNSDQTIDEKKRSDKGQQDFGTQPRDAAKKPKTNHRIP